MVWSWLDPPGEMEHSWRFYVCHLSYITPFSLRVWAHWASTTLNVGWNHLNMYGTCTKKRIWTSEKIKADSMGEMIHKHLGCSTIQVTLQDVACWHFSVLTEMSTFQLKQGPVMFKQHNRTLAELLWEKIKHQCQAHMANKEQQLYPISRFYCWTSDDTKEENRIGLQPNRNS